MFKKLSVLLAAIGIVFILNACKENTTSTLPIEVKEFEFLQNIEVGKQPAEIYFDEQKNLFHIFCLGADLNFNGEKDAGDENPSWWIFNKNDLTKATKVLDFDFGYMGFPFRPYFDIDNRQLIFSQNGKLKEYSIDDYSLISDNLSDYFASSVWKDGDILFLSISTGYTTPGYIIAYNTKTKVVIDSIGSGINVQQILGYTINGEKNFVVISEGTGSNDALLQFLTFNNNKFNLVKSFENIGNNANKMTILNNILALTLNGSNTVLIIDLNNLNIVNDIDIQTTGLSGPREVAFDGFGNIFVSTYNNDVRQFNYTTGEFIKTFEVDSKAEGISIIPNELMLICNISKSDYSANNIISIFTAKDNQN